MILLRCPFFVKKYADIKMLKKEGRKNYGKKHSGALWKLSI